MEDIEAGLTALVAEVERLGIRSIAVPPLGSGLGGLNWTEVRPRIERALGSIPNLAVFQYEPAGAPDPLLMAKSRSIPNMTPGRAALVSLMQQYLSGLLDPFVSLLELHKLMYFMQESGEDLKLRYVKAEYGPYAENLRHSLIAIEGYFVSGYADGGDSPKKHLELVPGAVTESEQYVASLPNTRDHLDRVAELVDGFESPFGLELLATVHWVASREHARTVDEAVAKTYAWGYRKQRFTRDQISLAWEVLAEKNWLGATPLSPHT
jgi:O-acetyl-ADP-ribose deacetylase (regulator of RNase III)